MKQINNLLKKFFLLTLLILVFGTGRLIQKIEKIFSLSHSSAQNQCWPLSPSAAASSSSGVISGAGAGGCGTSCGNPGCAACSGCSSSGCASGS